MFDYDVVIVGAGPAGLTAGIHLNRAGRRVLALEKELYGGALQHIDQIDDYPGFPDGITGAQLAAQMIEHATNTGVTLDQAEVTGVELFSRSRWVACSDGRGFSCGVVLLAGGLRMQKLGLAREDSLRGRGVIDCTPCDAGFFAGRPVVVVGSDDYAVRDALHLAKVGANVTLLAPRPELDLSPRWRNRLSEAPDIAVQYDAHLNALIGSDRVEAVAFTSGAEPAQVAAAGVAIRVGHHPDTEWLVDLIDLDTDQRVAVNGALETSARYVLSAGDMRSGARTSIAAAVGDGAAAAARALELLAELAPTM